MIGYTKRIRRAIMAALRPLTGTRATGTVTAKAAPGQGSITLPRLSFCVPVITSAGGRSQLSHELLLQTTTDATVDEVGTLVSVTSVLGGARHNLPSGTVVRWDPPLVGMVATATLSGPMINGADAAVGPGMLRQILPYETLVGGQPNLDTFLAKVRTTPALIIAWAGSVAVGKPGADVHRNDDLWRLYTITSPTASEHGDEALDILDAVESYLTNRSSADGFVFSAPAIEIRSRELVRTTQTAMVNSVTLVTSCGVRRTEVRSDDEYHSWLRNRFDLSTADPYPFPIVDGAIYPAGQSEYDSGFDTNFKG